MHYKLFIYYAYYNLFYMNDSGKKKYIIINS